MIKINILFVKFPGVRRTISIYVKPRTLKVFIRLFTKNPCTKWCSFIVRHHKAEKKSSNLSHVDFSIDFLISSDLLEVRIMTESALELIDGGDAL